MSKIVRIPEDQVVLVCNSRKAVFLRNAGHLAQPEFRIEAHTDFGRAEEVLMNSDRPGRRFDGGANAGAGGARSAMELPDPEEKHAEEVAGSLLAAVSEKHRKSPIAGLVIVAPPAFLGVLRQKMSAQIRDIVVGEVAKDLAEMPISEMQKSLLKVL